ncbi:MAG: universal stress protein [Actinobacteria bacterium]|nr:universal stress protein [Actinomycetota bacterium]
MFKSIVVGTDGSQPANEAVQRAADLAKLCGASLHIVTAYKPISELVFNPEALPIDIGSMVDPQRDATDICEAVGNKISTEGVSVHTHACPGNAADALVEVAEREKADLIVVGNRGMKGKRRVLGSVPNSVSHHAPCTVMIVSTS